MFDLLRKIKRKISGTPAVAPVQKKIVVTSEDLIKKYFSKGQIPWSEGYAEYKWKVITDAIHSYSVLNDFSGSGAIPNGYGKGVDDRSVEYPWLFSRIRNGKDRFLDAGSTFNFPEIIEHEALKDKEISILTFYPEKYKFNDKRISYVYADLREIPFRNEWFDEVICQSTLEHIGMDNSIYGYKSNDLDLAKKDYSYMEAIEEYIRILKTGGQLLMTFPFGKFENHGFFQQFDEEMLGKMTNRLKQNGNFSLDFFLYQKDGWIRAKMEQCRDAVSFNPHTGKGKGDDGAAHSRCICCLSFVKS